MENNEARSRSNTGNTAWQIIGRLVVSAIVLGITAFFTPGFSIDNIWTLAIAAIVLTIVDYLISKFTGLLISLTLLYSSTYFQQHNYCSLFY